MIETAVPIATRVGDEVELRLDRQGVGGYVWIVGALPNGLVALGEPERAVGEAVGDGTGLVYRLRAEHPGTYDVVCEHRRTWGSQELAERRTFTLTVAAN